MMKPGHIIYIYIYIIYQNDHLDERIKNPLLALVEITPIEVNRKIMKSGEIEHKMTLFHTMEPIEMIGFRHTFLFVSIYGLTWSSFNTR